jgi:transcription initiation factor TFIID subunit 2
VLSFQVANSMVGTWAGPPAMMTIFRKLFSSHSCPTIVRQNNFHNFQLYFLQKVSSFSHHVINHSCIILLFYIFLYQAIPCLMAGLRTVHGICPPEVHTFILDLFKYNDNSKNKVNLVQSTLDNPTLDKPNPVIVRHISW